MNLPYRQAVAAIVRQVRFTPEMLAARKYPPAARNLSSVICIGVRQKSRDLACPSDVEILGQLVLGITKQRRRLEFSPTLTDVDLQRLFLLSINTQTDTMEPGSRDWEVDPFT